MRPNKGMRFYHSRVLNSAKYDGRSPQLFQVTRIARGCVWYRPVYDYGTRIELGKPSYCLLTEFPKYCGSIVVGQIQDETLLEEV